MISEAFIQEVVSRVNIVDVIDAEVTLKKSGLNYSACCPFHHEKTPSFTVSPTKQFYHCFGCGVHGNVVGFLMEHKGLGFVDAISELAGQVGLTVPEFDAVDETKSTIGMRDMLEKAATLYKDNLKNSPAAIDYLKARGLEGKTAAKYMMGYAPPEWQNLKAIMDYNNSDVIDCGLANVSENKSVYDRLRDRIIFPIHNQKGEIIGFGGRILSEEKTADAPKYLNSPETLLFQKGNELYGLHLAKKSIRDTGKVLVVEGYMDVVKLSQYGVDYAVATMGTSTTAQHINRLSKHSDDIVFCFDGDKAGKLAGWRAAKNALPALTDKTRLSFLFLPAGHDPDSYISEFGKESFERQVASAIPLSAYIVEYLKEGNPLKSNEDKIKFLSDSEAVLSQIANQKNLLLLKKDISAVAGLSFSELQMVSPSHSLSPEKYSKRVLNAISLNRRIALIVTDNAALAELVDAAIFTDSIEDEQLKIVIEVCAANSKSSAAVIALALKGRVQEAFLIEFELDMHMQGEEIEGKFELLAIQNKVLTFKKRSTSFSEMQQLIQSKPFSSLTKEEISALMSFHEHLSS